MSSTVSGKHIMLHISALSNAVHFDSLMITLTSEYWSCNQEAVNGQQMKLQNIGKGQVVQDTITLHVI